MYSIEFQTTIKNGLIEIPPQYRQSLGNLSESVRVIILVEEAGKARENFIDRLLSQPLRVPGFRPMTREDLYAR